MTGAVGNASADPFQRDLTAPRPSDPVRSSWLLWLMQPFAIGVAVTATALLILAALAGFRVSSPLQFALRNESLQASPAVAALKSASQVWRGSGKAAPMRVIRPMRTLIQSGPTTFQWTTAGRTTSYTVHVVDDQTQEEAATSLQISPASSAVCAWTDPVSLTPGKRYRWYVTAIINEQEIDAPGIEEPRAKFSVLSESELTHLDELKKTNRGDHLVNGLLNLRAGLLDDAKDDFQSLIGRAEPDSRG